MSKRRALTATTLVTVVALGAVTSFAQPGATPDAKGGASAGSDGGATTTTASPTAAPTTGGSSETAPTTPEVSDTTRGAAMRAYQGALVNRRLAQADALRLEDVAAAAARAEDALRQRRTEDAIAALVAVVENPRFSLFEDTQEGRAALYFLGQAYADASIDDAARGYLKRVLAARGAWDRGGTYARRATSRLVQIAVESRRYDRGLGDVAIVPATAPDDTRGEVAYLTGRAKEARGDTAGALAAYQSVPTSSRFWSQSTYLAGLLHVEAGRHKDGENLFCKVADPKRQDKTTPVLADSRFFAVRDLARLALGRVAHEDSRFDDARYYYYLVPRDSDRLSEALYESATTRYEKKDYDGARELLDDLGKQTRHRYEDEAKILDAYVDLAQCKFPSADQKLRNFITTYEPVRDLARRIRESDVRTLALVSAARTGADASGSDAATLGAKPEAVRAVVALLRVDPLYLEVARVRAVLDREALGLRATQKNLVAIGQSLKTAGGLRPAIAEGEGAEDKRTRAEHEVAALARTIDDLGHAGAAKESTEPLLVELRALEARLEASSRKAPAKPTGELAAHGGDLPDLVQKDSELAAKYAAELDAARDDLKKAETRLAKDALFRLDLRLSRLLRRARLGRIESVLGKKRALEVEIEAIAAGYLPQDAVDSLEPARYLKDNEEYWPFEGDDWPDEFVGGEDFK